LLEPWVDDNGKPGGREGGEKWTRWYETPGGLMGVTIGGA